MGQPKNSKNRPNFATPQKPLSVFPVASAEWDRLVSEIEASGFQVRPAHRAAISLGATIAADIKSDWAELEKEGQYHNSPKGGIMAHPALI